MFHFLYCTFPVVFFVLYFFVLYFFILYFFVVFFVLYFFVLFFVCSIFCVVFFVLYVFCIFCVVFFCIIFFRIVLKSFHSLQQILLPCFWQIFGQTVKKKVCHLVGKLGLIHYLVLFLCLFQNYLSVRKLNCLILFSTALANVLVPINDNVLLDSQLCFIFITNTL